MLAAGHAHRLPEKDIVMIFVNDIKPDIFREEIYSRSFETLVDVMAETRHELANYCDIIEISERIKRPKVKKVRKPEAHISRKSGNCAKAPVGASLSEESEKMS